MRDLKNNRATVRDAINDDVRKKTIDFRINAKAKKWNGDIQGSKYDKQAIDAFDEFARLAGGGKKAKVKDSTRALIGRQLPDGSVKYIYNHYDGYPEYLGNVLKTHWTDQEKIGSLLEEGDVSFLGSTLERAPWNDDSKDDGSHTRFYRDRGDRHWRPRTAANIDELLGSDDAEAVDYVYLSGNDGWQYIKPFEKGKGWKKL